MAYDRLVMLDLLDVDCSSSATVLASSLRRLRGGGLRLASRFIAVSSRSSR